MQVRAPLPHAWHSPQCQCLSPSHPNSQSSLGTRQGHRLGLPAFAPSLISTDEVIASLQASAGVAELEPPEHYSWGRQDHCREKQSRVKASPTSPRSPSETLTRGHVLQSQGGGERSQYCTQSGSASTYEILAASLKFTVGVYR